jgi:hypothetical protein
MVMSSYTERWGRGSAWDEHPMVIAPPGTSLGQMDAQSLFSEITQALSLQPVGVYTPWATRSSDLDWEEITGTDTNIMLWGITDAEVNAVPTVTFGSPLPFIAILTKAPLSVTATAAMWEGTAYQAYETQAVYRQDDAKPVPTIYFLHWGERIDQASMPQKVLALEPRAASVGGALVFAAQIPVQNSTTRQPPVMPFSTALSTQNAITAPPAPAPAPEPAEPIQLRATPEKTNLVLPIAAGLGAMALAFVLWRHTRP